MKRRYLFTSTWVLLCFLCISCDKTSKPTVEDHIAEEIPSKPEEPNAPAEPEELAPLTASDIIFMNSFEDGHLNVWDDWDGNLPPKTTLLKDPGPFNTPDNHVLRLLVPPGRGNADVVKVLPSQHDKLYARWYVKWEEGFDFRAGNHGGGLSAGRRDLLGVAGNRPDGTDRVGVGFEYSPSTNGKAFLYTYYRGMYMDCVDPNGTCWADHFPCFLASRYCTNPAHKEKVDNPTPRLEAGKWYCVELLLDMGTATPTMEGADGIISFWIDGIEYGPFENLWLRTTPNLKVSLFNAALFHHGEHSDVGVLYDHVVVAKKRIGLGKVVGE
ncbi:hypothetical protein [Sphingobacterium pedocola]|uniref:Polysaccharide lyase n=1 Tax=Sphingobacterium pedocola TaxID=2082722 RepID=A0ABR9TD22_9SPHI|nr:hypothetical protein [Sphingobacterium pedocola]MBE8723255.1 hypothetical protein [Sphingobacterium pedocola]